MTKHNNIISMVVSHIIRLVLSFKAWKKLREIALDRDNYLCQMCLREDINRCKDCASHYLC
ncbi:hypothetical protein CSC52_0691 [Staphylococcus aureus]|nr:hypothetical protein CSC52_0691 [Staphylococcus aureus]